MYATLTQNPLVSIMKQYANRLKMVLIVQFCTYAVQSFHWLDGILRSFRIRSKTILNKDLNNTILNSKNPMLIIVHKLLYTVQVVIY